MSKRQFLTILLYAGIYLLSNIIAYCIVWFLFWIHMTPVTSSFHWIRP